MRFWYFVFSSGLLILLVLWIQKAWSGKLSPKAKYALWLVPALRLLVPFGMVERPVGSVLSLPYTVFESAADWLDAAGLPGLDAAGLFGQEADGLAESAGEAAGAGAQAAEGSFSAEEELAALGMAETGRPDREASGAEDSDMDEAGASRSGGWKAGFSLSAAGAVWLAGSLLLGSYALWSNWKFARMTSARCQMERDGRLPVYVGETAGAPCLFGVFRPRIVMGREIWEDETLRRYALWHEAEHYRQKDHIWSCLRVLLCVVYWWNPLVWLGTRRAGEDAELACDEGVTRACGDREKKEYGTALLRILECTKKRQTPLCGAASMGSGNKNMRRRMEAIVNTPKTRVFPFGFSAVFLTSALLAGCTALPSAVRMRTVWNQDVPVSCTMAVDYQMEFPDAPLGRLVYFEIYEYGERLGAYQISYRSPKELNRADAGTDLQVRFGNQWTLGMWNYLEISEGTEENRQTFYYPPLEGNLAFASSAIWSDGKTHRTEPDTSYVLAAQFYNTDGIGLSYGCEYLTETPREEWKEDFDQLARAILVRMVTSERPEEVLAERYGLEEYSQTMPDARTDGIEAFAEAWAGAFSARNGTVIREMAAQSVQQKLEEAGLLDAAQPDTFGMSSPWPWEQDYRILEASEAGVDILYYAMDSTPHLTVWREELSLVYVNGGYQVIRENLQYLDSISAAAEYFQAYPDGIISGTRMDYASNGLGEALNNNAVQNPDSEIYSGLFDPAQAAVTLLNLSEDVEVQAQGLVMVSGDTARTSVRLLFSDGGSAEIRMIRPWGTEGIWIPGTGAFENL